MGWAFLGMMVGVAQAADGGAGVGEVASPAVRTSVLMHLDASQFAFVPAGPERPAIGPSALAAGPQGAALIDPAARRLLVVEPGSVAEIPLPMVPDSVAAGPDGRWHVLLGRSVWTFGVEGQKEREFALPDLVPTSVTLAVDDGWVVADDAFGNHRPLFGVDGAAWKGGALVEPERPVRKVPGGVEVEGAFYAIPGQRGSGRRVGDWLIVESASTADSGAIEVQRWGIHLRTGSRIDIPTRGRRWVPTVDLSVDPAGALWILSPTNDGLDLVKVQP